MTEAERKAYAKGFEDALKMAADEVAIFLSLDPEIQKVRAKMIPAIGSLNPEGQSHDG